MPSPQSLVSPSQSIDELRDRRITVLNRRMDVVPDRVAPVTAVLTELGCGVRQTGDIALDPTPDDVVVIWGNAVWFPNALRSLEEMPPERRPFTVVWQAEPLPPPSSSGLRWPRLNARELAKIVLRDTRASDVYSNVRTYERLARNGLPDLITVSTMERGAFLEERGFETAFIPYGYEPSDGRDLGLERDIDVLLLGNLKVPPRRQVVRSLRRAGIAVEALGSYSDPLLWGESRTKLVNRSKIMLSLSRFPGTFGSKRFFLGMACNALVVSDPVWDPAPFVADVHFVESRIEDLPEVIQGVLSDDEKRLRIAQAGHDFATDELTMEKSMAQLVTVVAERLAAR